MSEYVTVKKVKTLPRLPLEGTIDLTYRCNNNCRHCWIRIPPCSKERKTELSYKEIRKIIDDAKRMGCRSWALSGGEPMLRPDFYEIFDYITSRAAYYKINTNGTSITPKIAKLLKRKGEKVIALCGATAEVHDHITRSRGSFELTMRGFRYLKEKGAGFVVQLITMKDNYHQWKEMLRLAASLSRHFKVGTPWLYLSASGDSKINEEIKYQRLSPKELLEIEEPSFPSIDIEPEDCKCNADKDYLFNSCITKKRDFHVDAYGQVSFCWAVKDPRLRYNLLKGSFKECWEDFLPSLANKIKVTKEYEKNCGSCESKKECRWCPVYGYLEHRRFNAKVEYLCGLTKKIKKLKEDWQGTNRRYYKIADIGICVESDLPIKDDTFQSKFKYFETGKGPKDIVTVRHHFSLPDLEGKNLGKEVYRKAPWIIYKKDDSWIYTVVSPITPYSPFSRIGVFNRNHTSCNIYHANEEAFLKGDSSSLTFLVSDQIILAPVLADMQGCFMHACGVSFNKNGLLFVGHSGSGKSTIANLLKEKAKILCDDRIIIRNYPAGFIIYGTWSHGSISRVSADSAPLKAIFFLRKSETNSINKIGDKKNVATMLLACLIKPLVTVDWWEKMLLLIEKISNEVPCYELYFNRGNELVELLKKL